MLSSFKFKVHFFISIIQFCYFLGNICHEYLANQKLDELLCAGDRKRVFLLFVLP